MPKDQTVVITGCTRGLGLAMARTFAGRDWTVAGCGTRPDAIAALAEDLGPPHLLMACDVSSDGDVGRFAGEVLARHGAPRLLVNNAGLINRTAPLWDVGPDEFARVVAVNLTGIHHLCRAFLPAMIEAGRGVIVNFSSGWGRSTSPDVAPYCATKWGVEGLTRALAQELPEGLAAVALNPGIIDTDMLRSCWGDEAGSFADPEAWAATAVPFIEKLGPGDNGRPLTVPGH